MSASSEQAKKGWETRRKNFTEEQIKKAASKAGKNSGGGFNSEKIGKDGLTGKERASKAGKIRSINNPFNFKHDKERAKRLSHEYHNKQKGETDDNSEVPG